MRDETAILTALEALEQALQEWGLWTAIAPSPEALASHMPFCCDTLSLQQWLQWLLVPRIRAILEAQAPLPARSSIAPYAEVVWPATPPYDALIALLRDLDSALTG